MVFTSKPNAQIEAHNRVPWDWKESWGWLFKPMHFRAVHKLRVALESGNTGWLASWLDSDVAVVVHSDRTEPPTIRVVRGVRDAVAWLQYGMVNQPGLVILEREVNGQAGLVLNQDGKPTAALTVDFTAGLVSAVWIQIHPEWRKDWAKV